MRVKSYAKINLYLKIIEKKQKYHLIETLMTPISIYDEIEIEESDFDEIIGMDIKHEDNIMYKTIDLFRTTYNIDKKYKIIIDKKIPMKAGLGGGSSNSACILRCLERMNNIVIENINDFALKIGSDVPFFLYNKVAKVYGFGEQIEFVKDMEKLKGIIIFDNDTFSAKEMYEAYDRNKSIDSIDTYNHLEKALNEDSKIKIDKIKEDLKESGAYFTLMSGSGGACFGLFDEDKLIKAYNLLKEKYKFVQLFESL